MPTASFVERGCHPPSLSAAPTGTRLAHTGEGRQGAPHGNDNRHNNPEKNYYNTIRDNWNKSHHRNHHSVSSPALSSSCCDHRHHHHKRKRVDTNSHQRVDRQRHHVKGSIISSFAAGQYLSGLLDSNPLSDQYPRQCRAIAGSPHHRSVRHRQTAWAQRGRSS